MSIAGLSPAPLDIFGSLVTYTDPTALPPGVSPDCQDVQFALGSVKTRDGLLSAVGTLAGGVNVNGLKTHITPSGTMRLLLLDSAGNLYRENPAGAAQLVTPGLAVNAFLASTTLFGREYIAIGNGNIGADFPWQYYDALQLDRVSQVGPGEPPAAADSATAGSISPGVHQVSVIFKTRQGYLTAPAPAGNWTAAGAKKVSLTNIPTGPANVVSRIVCFTGAGGASFYYIPATMVLADNTTTTLTVDFSDAQLLAGVTADPLFRLIELGETAGVAGYASRLFWWGERAKQNNWVNLTFDGGFDLSGNGRPLGWQRDATFGAGGSASTLAGWGNAYQITADGTTTTRGLITQSAVQDAQGVARIAANTDYSVRARVKRSAGLAQGTFHIHLFSTSGGISTAGLQLTAGAATTSYAEFIAQLTPPLASIPSDLVLRVYADGTPGPAGEYFLVDNIEVFATAAPVNGSLVRASLVENPESYDGISGFLNVAEQDGQQVRAAFALRGILYFVKDRSLYSTEDDGVNEPAKWAVTEVSRKIGTPSVQGVDVGDDFAAIAGRDGLYLFTGGDPQKLSEEIQATWNAINWQAGNRIWVRVDTQNKRILAGVPLGAATQPNAVLVCDYTDGLDSPLHITLSGDLRAAAKARRWTRWNIAANSCGVIERFDGTQKIFFGNNAANGKTYQLTPGQLSDDGAAINGYYATAYLSGTESGQVPPVGRQLFGYLQLNAGGAGSLNVTAFPNPGGVSVALRALPLMNPTAHDLEITTRIVGERTSYRIGTNALNQWFALSKLVPWLKPAPYSLVRGGV
jgi:hypothetical protein